MTEAAEEMELDSEAGFEDLKEKVNSAEQTIRELVQERPLTSFAVAVAAGYLFARLTRR